MRSPFQCHKKESSPSKRKLILSLLGTHLHNYSLQLAGYLFNYIVLRHWGGGEQKYALHIIIKPPKPFIFSWPCRILLFQLRFLSWERLRWENHFFLLLFAHFDVFIYSFFSSSFGMWQMSIINGSRPLPEVKSIEKQAHPQARQTGQETPSFSLSFWSANCRRLAILLVHLLLYFYATQSSFQLNNRTFLCDESVYLKAL